MSHIRSRLILTVVALGVVAAACGGAATTDSNQQAPPPGDEAPTASFLLFDGSEASFADYAGTPVVANWWASWCPSCVAEMSAAFLPAQQELGDRVAFLGLNIQDERSKALELVEETGVLFDLAEDATGDIYLELGGLGMPFTVFIDADGRVVETHNGPLTRNQLVDLIEELLLA